MSDSRRTMHIRIFVPCGIEAASRLNCPSSHFQQPPRTFITHNMPFAGASPSIRKVKHLAAVVPSLTVSLKFRASEVLACRGNILMGRTESCLSSKRPGRICESECTPTTVGLRDSFRCRLTCELGPARPGVDGSFTMLAQRFEKCPWDGGAQPP